MTHGDSLQLGPSLQSAVRRQVGTRAVLAVGSGKGGVGKTTVSVNLAVALARAGACLTGRQASVGVLDADVYGPNVPLMLGVRTLPPMREGRLVPAEAHGVKVMSMGFLLKEDEPVIWRGPMLHGVIQKFLNEVEWGPMDYLIVDLPPSTGDVPLTLSQTIPLTGAVVVTTPQDVALLDVRKAMAMFEKVRVPIIGVVENMSTFVCPSCRTETPIFRRGGGRAAAERAKVPFLGEIPLVPSVCEHGDAGTPIVAAEPDSAAAKAFIEMARQVAGRAAALVQTQPQFVGL
ncbi:MAG: Mrp/NBP35 family ATP-binding protein [Candidatus Omnitrophica bacterium]|nr:Mrp/NBP35 family ATP-binding protein [Candidatus Omnitrophota bacterium]